MAKKAIVGICMDMCPQNEIQWREKNRLLHEFEVTKQSEIKMKIKVTNREKNMNTSFWPKADVRKAVKSFSRSSAGQSMQKPEDLRPIKVLAKTVDYLLTSIAPKTSVPFNIIYDFIFDRLRSVRQDMSIQCSDDMECITILEQCVRFHIYSEFYFGDEEIRLYDKTINNTHLRECLQTLLKRYDSLQSVVSAKNRPLFEAIFLIYNLGTTDGLTRYGSLPKALTNHDWIYKAFRMGIDFENGLYYQVLRSIQTLKCPTLVLMATTKISLLHAIAIKAMNVAYSSPNTQFPIDDVTKWLCSFEQNREKATNYVKKLCENYNIPVVDNNWIAFNKNTFNSSAKNISSEKWSFAQNFVIQLSVSSLLQGRHECLHNVNGF